MAHWSLEDIDWHAFDPAKVDGDIVMVVKAAALVEHNGGDYGTYLRNVFHDDPVFAEAAANWAREEIQHGQALRRWAELADPSFDFESAFARFTATIKLPLDADASVRGSRSGELVARCIVEIGTSSYYTALHDATDEPVLKDICRRIAADELRHYKLFYSHMRRYQDAEGLSMVERLKVAFGRLAESEDDELPYAFYAANDNATAYDRKRFAREYLRRAFRHYRPAHIERAVAMLFKAVGLKPHGALQSLANRIAWWLLVGRARWYDRAA